MPIASKKYLIIIFDINIHVLLKRINKFRMNKTYGRLAFSSILFLVMA